MALADVPEAVAGGPVGRALVHQRRRPQRQRAVERVAVPGDPADVGGAPEHVVFLEVEDPVGGGDHAGQIAAGGVHDALGLAGGAGGVEDVEHVLGVHRLGLAVAGGVLHQAVPPVVAPLFDVHGELRPAALHHHHVLDGRAVLQGLVRELLERQDAAAAVAAVGGDEQLGLGVVDPVAERLGAEAAEDHRVNGADARAGQHGDGELGNHRQVDGHAVALAHPQALQHVGELVDLAVELPVGEGAAVAGFALPDQSRLVALAGSIRADVAVETVDADVELAAHEPLGLRRFPREHLAPGLEPLQARRPRGPEALRVARCLAVDAGVVHIGLATELRRGLEQALLAQQRGDFSLRRFAPLGRAPRLARAAPHFPG